EQWNPETRSHDRYVIDRVPVLNTANIRDGELRRLSTWENNPDALALVDNVYHRIAGISKDDGLITLQDAEGNTRLI
ncbi:hypothetical protein FSF23_030340, partial [Escherichia coli]|nr:hypothetical protein [Escherichia coli]